MSLELRQWIGRRIDRWSVIAAVAAVAVAALILPRAIHTDDLEVIRAALDASYGELWTEPFRDLYYRPLTSTLVKVGLDTIGANSLLRIVQALLVLASVWVFSRIVAPLVGPARLIGALCLTGAPFTFVSVAPFGVGIGDSIVGLALLVAIHAARSDDRAPWVLVVCAAVALTAKESGLVVAAYAGAECLRRRRLGFAALAAALALGYLAAHALMVEGRPYILRTGYLFDMLSVAEQRERFGDHPAALRVWTAAANFVSALLYAPYQGRLSMSPSIAAFAAITAATTALIAAHVAGQRRWRSAWPLLAVIPANAILGFAYARPRIMFAAYLAIALLLARALDERWRRNSRALVAVVGIGWLAVFASTAVRLAQMP